MTYRCFFLPFLILFLMPSLATATESEIASTLRRLSAARTVGGEALHSGLALARFYQDRAYQPVWSDGLQLLPVAEELLTALPTVAEEGMDPQTYHLPALVERSRRFHTLPTSDLAAELDLLLSDAFMHLAADSLRGRIAPASVDRKWHIPREEGDPVRMLKQALAGGHIRDSLQALLPQDSAYAALRCAWQNYRRLAAAGGWPQLQIKPSLRPGAMGPEVLGLRQRLVMTDDLLVEAPSDESFDSELEGAVRHFQTRHGLVVDGVVGPATLAALNVPAAQRVRQLAVNLERWRWLPRQFGERYLRVNIPAFDLDLVEKGETVLTMRVIVGRQLRPTPAFVGRMTYLVLNPYWHVPRRLAVEDLLPKMQADAGYLRKEEIEVLTPGGQRLDPTIIDWWRLSAGNFPYSLRQRPGRKNALGKIKFIFPNAYDIYLHDTPSRKLFARDQRSFSSGCIRVEKPFELAQWLLQDSPQASLAALEESLKTAVNAVVPLPSSLPIYLIYLTAWVGGDGTVNLHSDLYQRDHRLDLALRQPRP